MAHTPGSLMELLLLPMQEMETFPLGKSLPQPQTFAFHLSPLCLLLFVPHGPAARCCGAGYVTYLETGGVLRSGLNVIWRVSFRQSVDVISRSSNLRRVC